MSANATKTHLSGPHLAWAAGHAIVLLSSLYTFFKLATFGSPSPYIYSIAYAGAMMSWGIVIFKAFGIPQPNAAYLQRFLNDENGEYLLLAAFWFWNKPIYISLLPYSVFSLFHTLGFVRQTFLPPVPSKKAGATPAATAQQQQGLVNLSKTIQTWVKRNYDTAMIIVSYTEVMLVFPYVLLGAILFRNSFLLPIAFANFLRLRYALSPQTRKAFAYVDSQVVGGITGHPSVPAPIKQGVQVVKNLVVKYGAAATRPAPGTQPAARRE